MADTSDSEGSLFARLLIILYALGIVDLGAQPIQKEYGSFTEFIRQKSQVLAGQLSKGDNKNFLGDAKSTRSTLRTQTLPTEPEKTPGVVEPSAKKAPVDNLTEKDRKALNQLLKGL